MTKKRRGGRREPPGGAPKKGHVRLVCYVQPGTRKAIDEEAARGEFTLGQVIDRWLGLIGGVKETTDKTPDNPEVKND